MKFPSKEISDFFTSPFCKGKCQNDVISEDLIKTLALSDFWQLSVISSLFGMADNYVKHAGIFYGCGACAVRGVSLGFIASAGSVFGAFLSAYLYKWLKPKLESSQKPLVQKVNKHVTHRRVVALGAGLGLLCASYWGNHFAKPIGDEIVQWGKESRAKPPITAPAPTIPSRPATRSPSHNSPAPSHP